MHVPVVATFTHDFRHPEDRRCCAGGWRSEHHWRTGWNGRQIEATAMTQVDSSGRDILVVPEGNRLRGTTGRVGQVGES